jgi:hypothetical protein
MAAAWSTWRAYLRQAKASAYKWAARHDTKPGKRLKPLEAVDAGVDVSPDHFIGERL